MEDFDREKAYAKFQSRLKQNEESALMCEANKLRAERLEEENNNLTLRVASAEMHANSVERAAGKMKDLLDDAAELMREYDAIFSRLLDLNKRMKGWRGH